MRCDATIFPRTAIVLPSGHNAVKIITGPLNFVIADHYDLRRYVHIRGISALVFPLQQ